jgi:hypothetical protein
MNQAVRDFFFGQASIGADDAQRHRKVESRAFFLYVGRRKVDRDVRRRNVVAAVLQRGAHAITAFAHGGVGQADSMKVVLVALDAGAVHFHLNNVGVDAVDGRAEGFVEHAIF